MSEYLLPPAFSIFLLISIWAGIMLHLTPKGIQNFIGELFDSPTNKFNSWGKKTWYSRLLYVCITPFVYVFGFAFLILVIAPICNLLELLWQFPGKIIYWIAQGKFPEHSALFHKWEKKVEQE